MYHKKIKRLTVKEAIEQGYHHAADKTCETIFCIGSDNPDDIGSQELYLCSKEGEVITISPEDIYEDLAENLAINRDVTDDDDEIGQMVRDAVNWQEVADKINEALSDYPIYRPTDIRLVP
jgi:hypothetical protein